MSELGPGWPPPPYGCPAGGLDDIVDRQGWLALPNPHPTPSTQQLILRWLVELQATRRIVLRQVQLADGSPGLLVVDRAVWACPREVA